MVIESRELVWWERERLRWSYAEYHSHIMWEMQCLLNQEAIHEVMRQYDEGLIPIWEFVNKFIYTAYSIP